MAQLTQARADVEQVRAEWVGRVAALADRVAGLAAAEGWAVDRRTETIPERRLGTYDAAALTVYPPDSEVSVTPVALEMLGRTGGRVDVLGIPSLSRIMLLGRPGGEWLLVTDSNVPLRVPWTRETFVQLVADLLA